MVDVKALTLAIIANGAAEELFRDALRRVAENIADPNTDPSKIRRIDLRISFAPDDDRRAGDALIDVSTKLASVKGVKTNVYFGKHGGQDTAVEGPQPLEMFPPQPSGPRAVPAAGGAS